MFEDSLVESSGRLKTRRGWTTMLSFSLQVLFLGGLILLPLIYTEALPKQQLMSFLVAPPPPPPPPPPAAAVQIKTVKVESDIVNGELRQPTKIPDKIKMVQEDAPPPPVTATGGVVGGVPGGVPGGSLGGVIGGIIGSAPVAVPKVATPQRIRVSSGVAQGMLIQEVRPVYPPMAKMARVQGTVVLAAVISKQGTIEGLKVISGHPMLIQSAVDAVQQWRYKPYMLSGEPVEVDTQISVVFTLSGG